MKYSVEVIIEKPIDEVIEKFSDPNNLSKWQPGLQSTKQLEGKPGAVGAKQQMNYLMGKRKVEMIETITVNDLPREFSAIYVAKKVWNQSKNFFATNQHGQTVYFAENEFQFKGMIKVIGWVMPGMFKK
jgi:hypothetical protein